MLTAVLMTALATSPRPGLNGTTEIQVLGVKGEGVPIAALQSFLTARKHSFNACYEDRLVTDPKAGGTMRLAFTINPQGRAEAVVAETKLPFIGECVASLVRGLAFSVRPEAPVKVEAQVTFAKATAAPVGKDAPPPPPLRGDPFGAMNVVIRGKVEVRIEHVGARDVDVGALERYVRSRKAQLTQCYEKELVQRPALNGRLAVSFMIAPSGRVVSVEADNEKLGTVPGCVRTAIGGWAMPFKPADDTGVMMTLTFDL